MKGDRITDMDLPTLPAGLPEFCANLPQRLVAFQALAEALPDPARQIPEVREALHPKLNRTVVLMVDPPLRWVCQYQWHPADEGNFA